MRPTQHPSNNDVLAPPAGATADECAPLAITRLLFMPGHVRAVASYWTPTAEELALLNQGKAVRLSAVGTTHPPVYIGVDGDGLI